MRVIALRSKHRQDSRQVMETIRTMETIPFDKLPARSVIKDFSGLPVGQRVSIPSTHPVLEQVIKLHDNFFAVGDTLQANHIRHVAEDNGYSINTMRDTLTGSVDLWFKKEDHG